MNYDNYSHERKLFSCDKLLSSRYYFIHFVHDPLTTISTENMFLRDFLVKLQGHFEEIVQEYYMYSDVLNRFKSSKRTTICFSTGN